MTVANSQNRPVIFVLPSLEAGGAERVIINVANELSNTKKIYIAHVRSGGNLTGLVKESVSTLNLTNKYLWLFRIIWYVYKLKPCSLVATNFDINASLLLIKFLLPSGCALVLREPLSIHGAPSESKVPVFRYLVFKFIYRYADSLILLSDGMKNEFVKLCPKIESKIAVIPNGVNLSRFEKIQALGQENNYKQYLVTVCRLEYQKGLDILISAFAKVKKKFPEFKLLLIGEGSQRKKLQQQIEELHLEDSVKMLGFIDNPTPLVKGASLFVLSSRYEGLSNAMLEALCLGVPVVAVKKHTSAGEILRENISGFLVDECDELSLEHALLRALSGLDKIDRNRISQWACDEFSLAKMISNYRRVLGEYCITKSS